MNDTAETDVMQGSLIAGKVACSIVFPVHNEINAIQNNLVAIYNYFKDILDERFELIIIDNGSNDHTDLFMPDFINFSEITRGDIVFESIKDKGRGPALRRAFDLAKGNYIAVMAIDRAWNEIFVSDALKILKNSSISIVYGAKSHEKSTVKRPAYRMLGSYVVSMIIKCFFGISCHDTQCIKVFRAKEVPFLHELNNNNYFAETEFYLRAVKNNLSSISIPVEVSDFRKSSKVKINSLFEFIREAYYFRRNVWQ